MTAEQPGEISFLSEFAVRFGIDIVISVLVAVVLQSLIRAVDRSGVLLLVNVLSINLVAILVIWIIGYRPQDTFQLEAVRARIRRRVRMLALALIVLSVFLGGVTYLTYQSVQFEQKVETEVHEMLNEQPYQQLGFLDYTVGSSKTAIVFDEAGFAAGGPIKVPVTLDRPTGIKYPTFAEILDRRLTQHTGRDVIVEVRFVDADRTASAWL